MACDRCLDRHDNGDQLIESHTNPTARTIRFAHLIGTLPSEVFRTFGTVAWWLNVGVSKMLWRTTSRQSAVATHSGGVS